MSGYKIETYTKRGFTEEEARHQISIRRPTNVAYWINKGFSEEEAVVQRDNHQNKACKKSMERPPEKKSEDSCKSVAYWVKRGLSEEDAVSKISESQSTFSFEKCVKEYGEIEGRKIWKNRQSKWQTSLRAKSIEDVAEINSKKCISPMSYIRRGFSEEVAREKYIEYCEKKGNECFVVLKDLEDFLYKKLDSISMGWYLPLELIKKRYLNKPSYFYFFKRPAPIDEWLLTFLPLKAAMGDIILKGSSKWQIIGRGNYVMWTKSGKFLRSGNEIAFYHMLIERGFKEEIDFEFEDCYPNSLLRYDFKIKMGTSSEYVELAGEECESYVQHMIYKKATFGSIILRNKNEFEEYISGL